MMISIEQYLSVGYLGIYFAIMYKWARHYVDSFRKNKEIVKSSKAEELSLLTMQHDEILKERMSMEEEAFKILTLYEMTKEIAKSFDEEKAYAIFEQKLKQYIDFSECRFLEAQDPEVRKLRRNDDYFVFNLRGKGVKIGYVVLKDVAEDDQEKVVILGHQFALALRRVKLYQALERVAITDGLTELHTRRYLMERFREEFNRSKLRKMNMAFLMIDVDYFKSYNDKYGHLTGDLILQKIAEIVKDNIREIDIAGRYGGEEFCVILPDTDVAGARYAAERIRLAAEQAVIQAYDTSVKVTLSVGVSTFPEDAQSVENLIEKADKALYQAKKGGRNRIAFFSV